jgi:hypothetical protein
VLGPSGNLVGRQAHPNGWSVSFDGTNFTVSSSASAQIGDYYRVRYHNANSLAGGGSSGSFGVTPNLSSTGSTAATSGSSGTSGGSYCLNLYAVPEYEQIYLSWNPAPTNTAWYLYRGTSSTSLTTLIASGTASSSPPTSVTDTNVTGGTTYYYQITVANAAFDGSSSRVSDIASATPYNGAIPTVQVASVQETRSHVLTANYTAGPATQETATGAWTDMQGLAHTITTTQSYYLTSDNGLNDTLTTTATSPVPVTASFTDQYSSSHPSFTTSGWLINQNSFPGIMTYPSSGGQGRLFVVSNMSWQSTHVSNGQNVVDFSGLTTAMTSRRDYNAVYVVANAVAVDSRKVYGQPDITGELPEDANAPSRAVNFNGWVYNGGIFAGNSPAGGTDFSGTARIQFYLTNLPTFVDPIWEDLVICYLGSTTNYGADPNYSLFIPSSMDTYYNALYSSVTWTNSWTLSSSTLASSQSLGSLASGQYVNFQSSGQPKEVLVALTNESSDISGGVADWRYFATPAYAAASGLISVADATPHAWVLDQTLSEP